MSRTPHVIKLMIADKHELFSEGLRHILNREKDMECVGLAHDGVEAVRLAKELLPDIVIMDIMLPIDGAEAAKQIKSACPDTRIILLTHCYEPHCIQSSILIGADGYLLKNVPEKALIDAIRMIYAGEGVFNLEIVNSMMSLLSNRTDEYKDKLCDLSSRELEVLKCVARGMSNREVADKLYISSHTVGIHLVNIYKKLGVRSRTGAIAYALATGLIEITELSSNTLELDGQSNKL
jgi:DNA-binding NarL/FixJ family response regulator